MRSNNYISILYTKRLKKSVPVICALIASVLIFFISSSFILYYPVACGTVTQVSSCNASVILNAEANQPNYTWSTGETTSSITVTSSGTYWWETVDFTNNKVTNGDFTAGNTGFQSQYTYIDPNGSTGVFGALTKEKYYTISDDPSKTHIGFPSFPDHTGNNSGPRSMMIINGADVPNVTVWSEMVPIVPNTDYVFSIWATSVSDTNPGQLSFSINGQTVGSAIQLTSGTPDWHNFTVRWNSGSSNSADIAIINQNTLGMGNDFALDDIAFSPVCRNTYNVNLYANPPKPSITIR